MKPYYRLSENAQQLINYVNLSMNGGDDAIVFGLSKYLADRLPLPCEAVKGVDAYFSEQCLPTLQGQLDKILAVFNINIDQVEEVTVRFWKTRYVILHQPDYLTMGVNVSMATVFNLHRYFPPNDLVILDNKAQDILLRATEFSAYFEETKNG